MGKTWRKVRTICTLVLACFSFSSVSETLVAPSSFVVYQGDITQWLTEQMAPYLVPNTVLASQINFSQPYNTIVHSPEWQGALTFTWTKDATNNVWVFDAQSTNLVLLASELEVHDTILETIGGSTVSVRVDAVCPNLNLSMPGVWKVHGELPMAWNGTALAAPLQNFLLTPSTQVPVLSLGACSGTGGLATFLNQRIAAGFKSPAQMQTMAAAQIQAFVNAQLAKAQSHLGQAHSFSLLGANVIFTPSLPSTLPNGTWILDGTMVLTGGGPNTTTTLPKEYTVENLSDADASGFAFSSVDFWPAVLNFAQSAGLLTDQFPSSGIASFTSFLADRFEQFFVWQDLWNFDVSTVFQFNLRTTQAPQITTMDNLQRGGVQFGISAPIDAVMAAPTNLGTLPYVEFYSSAPATAQLNAQAAKSGALQVTYSLETAPVSYIYRPEYMKVRTPADGIDTYAIASSVVSSLTNQVWSYTIPASASPFPGDTMYFRNLFFGPATFRIEMAITPTTN